MQQFVLVFASQPQQNAYETHLFQTLVKTLEKETAMEMHCVQSKPTSFSPSAHFACPICKRQPRRSAITFCMPIWPKPNANKTFWT